MLGHLIQAEEETQLTTIYRVESGSTRTLYTSVSFEEARKMGFEKFGRLLART